MFSSGFELVLLLINRRLDFVGGHRSDTGADGVGAFRTFDWSGIQRRMYFEQIVEDVQIAGARIHTAVIGQAVRGEDRLAGLFVMAVGGDGDIVAIEGILRQLRLGVILDPFDELRIGRPEGGDESFDFFWVEAERGAGHRIIARTHTRVAFGKLVGVFQGELEPEAREVKCTGQRARGEGAKCGNCFHCILFVVVFVFTNTNAPTMETF